MGVVNLNVSFDWTLIGSARLLSRVTSLPEPKPETVTLTEKVVSLHKTATVLTSAVMPSPLPAFTVHVLPIGCVATVTE
ncbi:MAG: hypothetical protein EBV34_17330 [Betaproteobacteria bacterium]|nr:hypothetical protein [Betaproteobacteria bacterium]